MTKAEESREKKNSEKKAVLCPIFYTVIPREYQAGVPISLQQIQGLLAYTPSQSHFLQSQINQTVDIVLSNSRRIDTIRCPVCVRTATVGAQVFELQHIG